MTEQEHFIYRIIGKITESDAPIVFKGAMITKLILDEHNYTQTKRTTNDIDANWVGEPPAMDELVRVVSQSLETVGGVLYAEAERMYAPGRSAGIRIIDKQSNTQIISMDITIKPVLGSRLYYYGEAAIRGVLPNAVLGDKISVLSGDRIFRRIKDMLDVYALADCLEINTTDIYAAIKGAERTLGTFEAFLHRRDELSRAYGKMRGVVGKPDFNDIYAYLSVFLEPFMQHDKTPRVWLGGTGSWQMMGSSS
jgi:hypothetical protein